MNVQSNQSLNAVKRQSEVDEWLSNIQTLARKLGVDAELLESRLSPVLRAVPDAKNDEDRPRVVLVPLATALREVAEIVSATMLRVDDMLERLEL